MCYYLTSKTHYISISLYLLSSSPTLFYPLPLFLYLLSKLKLVLLRGLVVDYLSARQARKFLPLSLPFIPFHLLYPSLLSPTTFLLKNTTLKSSFIKGKPPTLLHTTLEAPLPLPRPLDPLLRKNQFM